MGERGTRLGLALVCALAAPVAGAGVARAETGFDVSVERFEVTGDAPFTDGFDDGLRDAAPTSHFVDRGATEVSERDGALRLTDDDGAGGSPGYDLTVLDRPLRRSDAAASVTVSLRGGAHAAIRGLVLAPGDPIAAGAERRGLVLVAGRGPLLAVPPPPGSTSSLLYLLMGGVPLLGGDYGIALPGPEFPFDPSRALVPPQDGELAGLPGSGEWLRNIATSAAVVTLGVPVCEPPPEISHPQPPPALLCGGGGEEIVALSDGVVAACAELPAGSEGAAIELRIEVLAASPLVRAAYSLDGGASFVDASAWRVPAPVAGVALAAGARLPGLLARGVPRPGARWVDYSGLATEEGITRGAGGAIVRLDGVLSRQPFPSRPETLAGTQLMPWSPKGDPGPRSPLQPETPIGVSGGTFSLVSADERDLRVSPGTAELDTPRGRLRAIVEPGLPLGPVLGRLVCSASVGLNPFDLNACSVSDWIEITLPSIEPATLLQSWTGLGGAPPLTTDPRPQPGTVGYQGGPICTRVLSSGQQVILPGCRSPGDPGYDPAIDGPDPTQAGIGFPVGMVGIPPLGSVTIPGIDVLYRHPFTGQAWRSEAAAASWNLQMLLVARSTGAGGDPAEVFDPARAYRTDGCSYVLPGPCRAVRAFRSLAIEPLPDDPATGAAPLRWIWQVGASYRITEATGDFAALAGGRLHVAGPARSEIPGVAALVGFFATPPPVADADGDGVREPKDRCPARANPMQEDADGDRVGDACDVCTLDADPSQRDTDGDGIGNRCDADLDNDGRVGLRDLALLKVRMFTRDPNADLDGDGRVSLRDLALLKRRMFRPPGPAAPRLP